MSTIDTSTVPDYPGLLRLDGKAAIVVGAGQGMGRQIAHALSSAGARVMCVDLDEQLVTQVAKEFQAAQDKANAIKEAFDSWIYADEARADKLATLYNEKYNNLVVRDFDG
ncbi:MAG: SDR family NAD(P)-dependent oxidoreductase, partial [Actinomycetota bacterium]